MHASLTESRAMGYTAPLNDMLFVMNELAGLPEIGRLPGWGEATADTAQAVLEENARFVQEVIAPLSRAGDIAPSTWHDGKVTAAAGFKAAFTAYAQAGWQGVQHPVEYGGQGLPKLIATACIEMLNSGDLSFALCPLLTDGAIEALLTAGSPEQRTTFLPHLISGKWTGTMNLTESQAGSDLALLRTRAVPQADGTYRISGQKIFITWGEHDLAENIVHLVLARTPDAPEGVKGTSLFIVPKFLVNADGSLGARNDVVCASIEHKLGIKASPTAVLIYGGAEVTNTSAANTSAVNTGAANAEDANAGGASQTQGAIGYLVGEENHGLEYMFVMMNAARFAVGMQGIAAAERACQQAVAYARERVQSRDVAGSSGPVAIVHHPDVRRMLMRMRAQVEAARALAYFAAGQADLAHGHPDAARRLQAMALYEYLVPIVKGWSTEMSVEVASLAIQVHGGMGYIEETGVAQMYRDARILPIYEGTTAIQANDLVGRKTARDAGATARALIELARATVADLEHEKSGQGGAEHFAAIAEQLAAGCAALEDVVAFTVAHAKQDIRAVFAGSVAYLQLAGIVLGGWQLARAALAAQRLLAAGDRQTDATSATGYDPDFLREKIITARFFADHLLSQSAGLRHAIVKGSAGVLGIEPERF